MQFKTTAIYISGAICGHTWMPQAMAGFEFKQNARGPFGFYPEGESWAFRDALLHVLMRNGGDFQDARFSEDTELVIERKAYDGPGRYRVHVKRIPVGKLPDCGDLIHADTFAGDFWGED